MGWILEICGWVVSLGSVGGLDPVDSCAGWILGIRVLVDFRGYRGRY